MECEPEKYIFVILVKKNIFITIVAQHCRFCAKRIVAIVQINQCKNSAERISRSLFVTRVQEVNNCHYSA